MILKCKPVKVQIYINSSRKSMSKIKSELGCDAIINGGLYNMSTFKPVCHLKVDGKVLATESWSSWGFGWNTADVQWMTSNDQPKVQNFISCVELINNGVAKTLNYQSALGGKRGRTAIGLTANNELVLFCSKDGSSDAKTPEMLRDYLLQQGCKYALMLDGGGSSQCITPAGTITSTRNVQNFICVWYNKAATPTTTTTTTTTPQANPKCPYKEPTALIRAGSRGEGAKWVQWHLNMCGNSLVVDGIFGTLSVKALKNFQASAKIVVDGLCGGETRRKLKEKVDG